MSEFFQGVTFANQNVTPADDAILRRSLLSDGVLTGCELTYAGYTLTMASGYLIACGRQIRRPKVENWAISDATSGYARVLMTIDLTRTATEEVFDQINTSIEYATSKDGFSALIQDDITATGYKYQVVLAIVSLGTGGITGIASCLAPARSYGPNYNLLDNSDFRNPVNQRGINTFKGSGYTIDRWQVWNGTVAVGNGYINSPEGIYQFVGMPLDKVYTLALCGEDGSIAAVSGIPGQQEARAEKNGVTAVLTTINGYVEVIAGGAANLIWAALYEGEYTADTLPAYRPKGYAAELAECQRYFQIHCLAQPVCGTYSDSTQTLLMCQFSAPQSMRVQPTFTQLEVGTELRAGGSSYTLTNPMIKQVDIDDYQLGNQNGRVVIKSITKSVSKYAGYINGNIKFTLSADL